MWVLKDVDELKFVPEVEMALLATSDKVAIELLYTDVPSTGLRVEVVINQNIPADLPVAKVQVPTGHKLSSSFEVDWS